MCLERMTCISVFDSVNVFGILTTLFLKSLASSPLLLLIPSSPVSLLPLSLLLLLLLLLLVALIGVGKIEESKSVSSSTIMSSITTTTNTVDLYNLYQNEPRLFERTHSLILYIENYEAFVNYMYHHIVDNFEIEPRAFELSNSLKTEVRSILCATNGNKSLRYDHKNITLSRYRCLCGYNVDINEALHIHDEGKVGVVLCSEPEIAAALYIDRTVFGPIKCKIFSNIKYWVLNATIDSIQLRLIRNKNPVTLLRDSEKTDTAVIHGDLYPSFCLVFLYDRRRVIADESIKKLRYLYSNDSDDLFVDTRLSKNNINIEELSNKLCLFDCYSINNNCYEIMVKTRRGRSASPTSRRRSASPSSRRGRRGNRKSSPVSKRRRSRSRSRSGTRGAKNHARSRSRSASRTR